MDNRNILDIGSIISDIKLGAASKISQVFQEKKSNEDDSYFSQATEFEDKGPIGDYEATYQELCHLLENIKQKWETEDPDENLANKYYQRDLLYLYDRISLDMDYLNGYPDRNNEWLEKLLELKYEIRNMF